jgi:hypothetical protein
VTTSSPPAIISERTISRKVKEGKLVRLRIAFEDDHVTRSEITGDFFMHPEEDLTLLENALRGCRRGDEEATVKGRLESIATEHRLNIIGFSLSDLASMFAEASR